MSGDWTVRQYPVSPAARELWLPEPQPRFVHPPGPGKRADGKLWFDGPSRAALTADKAELAQVATDEMAEKKIKFTGEKVRPRDVRRGDRWLPWHFKIGNTNDSSSDSW